MVEGDPRTDTRAGAAHVGGVLWLAAFSRQRPRDSARKHALEVADVAVEILSPRDDLQEQRPKCQWYLEQAAQVPRVSNTFRTRAAGARWASTMPCSSCGECARHSTPQLDGDLPICL